MLTVIDEREYKSILASRLRGNALLHRQYHTAMHTLISRWANRFTPHQLMIVMFVLDRTFYHDKLSETVVFDQFLHGMQRQSHDEMVFSGLNISLPTLLKQLKTLAEDDVLHVRACFGRDGKTEVKPRIYAINCKKLFNLNIADERNPMILREPKQKKQVEHDDSEGEIVQTKSSISLKVSKKVRQNGAQTPPKDFEGIYIHNTDTKVSIVGGAALAEPRTKIDPLAVVAKMRQQRMERAATQRSTRTATRASNPHGQANVQDMIDTAMHAYLPTLPRMVVAAKPLGVLKKRIAEAKIDMAEFIDWAVRYWTTTVSQHERANRGRIGEGDRTHTHKPLPAAPDFTTMCYRFPYFASCYRSHLIAAASGHATSREEQLKQQVEKLKRTVTHVRQEAQGAHERERNLRRRVQATSAPAAPEARPTPTRIRRTPVAATALALDDDPLPTWEEAQNKRRTK
jgi:hypothetical protein